MSGENMRLVYDDFPVMITLESGNNRGNEIVLQVIEQLVGGHVCNLGWFAWLCLLLDN